jgi:diguanylate cyclase (GGDEF)-like protein
MSAESEYGPQQPQRAARVVVVDDDRLNRELVRDALRHLRVECCEHAEAALESLAREPADLVISDLTMPGITGLELLERVRREHPGTEFVLLTANASVESAVAALRIGASDYLTKPVREEELVLVIERILGRRRLLAENVRLRDALAAVESCHTLIRCLDASEIYVVALDLLLAQLARRRGLALFHRTAVPMSDGVAFRGFDESESNRLHELLVGRKRIDVRSVQAFGVLDRGPLHEVFDAAGVGAGPVLAIPIRGRESEAGVLWLFEDGRPFADSDLERARFVAGHAEIALHNAERYNRAKERAFIDDVTEVYNVRYLFQAADREIQRADRYGKELSVLFLDLDRFKLVNDRFGHLVGSQTLRRLSQVLGECVRQVDTLARYGGDEFTILLVDTGLEAALAIAERIRRRVADTLFDGGPDAPVRLTLSVGVATCPRHGREREGLLDLADKAMYRAKSRGRNCVCSADELADG